MGKKKPKKNPHAHALPEEVLTRRSELFRSGASGIHADQKARAYRLPGTNRVGSRKARTRLAANDSLRSNSRGEYFLTV